MPVFDERTRRWTGNAKCPIGYYCEEGSTEPRPCPEGTYGIQSEAVQSSYGWTPPSDTVPIGFWVKGCYPCPPGYYCDQVNMTTIDVESDLGPKPCPEGRFCELGSSRPSKTCKVGHYCPEATPIEVPCPPGQYQNERGQSTCKTCESGYYCDSFGGTSEQTMCPAGHYCPEGTFTPIPCKPGTYNPILRATDQSDCLPCQLGYFCPNFGMSLSSDDKEQFVCQPGYICQLGSTVRNPDDRQENNGVLVSGLFSIFPQTAKCGLIYVG